MPDHSALRQQLQQIRDERATRRNTADRVGNALLALLAAIEDQEGSFLSRVSDDTAEGRISFNAGLSAQEADIGAAAIGEMTAPTTHRAVATFLQAIEAAAGICSPVHDAASQRGFALLPYEEGKYALALSRLEVWGKAIFSELEVRKLTAVGGNLIISPAGGAIKHVQELRDTEADGTPLTGWRCFLQASDGEQATTNTWAPGDQARCQTFNAASGTTLQAENRYYWRLVTAASEQPEKIIAADGTELYDGHTFHYIDLSAADHDATSDDAPMAGDAIAQMGNRTDTSRQGLIVIATTADDAPSIAAYKNVHGYYLEREGETHTVFRLAPSGIVLNTDSFQWTNDAGVDSSQKTYRMAWSKDETPYYYYDEVTHDGCLWLCVTGSPDGTLDEPSADSPDWQCETPASADQFSVLVTGPSTLINGQGSLTLTARLYKNGDDITSQALAAAFSWERASDNASDDLTWNALHKALGPTITITAEDLFRRAVFTCTANLDGL